MSFKEEGYRPPAAVRHLRGFRHPEAKTSAATSAANAAALAALPEEVKPSIPDTLLTHAAKLRQVVNEDVQGLADAPSAARLSERKSGALRFYDNRYRSALANVIAAMPATVLTDRRADLLARLDKGYALQLDDRVADLFARLLLELEVVEDAIAGTDVARARHVARIHSIEQARS